MNNKNKDVKINPWRKLWEHKSIKLTTLSVLILSTFSIAFVAYFWIQTPQAIRNPIITHYHFRIQLISEGKNINFGDGKFQTPFKKGVCSDALTAEPIHFHDGNPQMVHIHWNKMTGGLFFKNYGLNLIGGVNDTLGWRFDNLWPRQVKTHSDTALSGLNGKKLHVYTGDEQGFEKKDSQDFINQDFESFFGQKSIFNQQKESTTYKLPSSKALAHGHGQAETDVGVDEVSKNELKEINDLVGNVVIFAQENEPTSEEVRQKFNELTPLGKSLCGG
jgi:hypothetical protein